MADQTESLSDKILNTVKSFVQTPEYNILLLGETGTGKSTTINALANYLKYNNFDDAKGGEFEKMIPANFKLPNPSGSGDQVEIKCGKEDVNERVSLGASSTQLPSAYTFKLGDKVLRLIDTPGIGDTRGEMVDRENFDNILSHLHQYTHLHGILVLLRANQTRRTANFRYSITELLAHLHKSAKTNLIFCFTFSRTTFYRPGDGYHTLKEFLNEELSDVQIQLKPGENCFFIDNEAYRFLVAEKQGYIFKGNQEKEYRESWEKSVQQSNDMWRKVAQNAAHNLRDTISLNNAQKLIMELAEPMVRLQAMITVNIARILEQENILKNSTHDKVSLEKFLNVEVDFLNSEPLEYPRTVCTELGCIDEIDYQGKKQTHHKTLCHPHCYLNAVGVNIKAHPKLKHCSAMNLQGYCNNCKCHWEKHMHIRVLYKLEKRPAIDKNKKAEIELIENTIDSAQYAISLMQDVIREYKEEYSTILDISAKFAWILVQNSSTPYNHFIEPYLELLMTEEEAKIEANPDYSKEAYESLKTMMVTHQQKVHSLEEAIKRREQEEVKVEDIFMYRDYLLKLKYTGEQFEQMLNIAKFVNEKEIEQIPEKILDLTKSMVENKPFWKIW